MNRKIEVMVANPAGNITILVKTHFDKKDYQEVATKLLSLEELKGEQVAFIKHEGKMEDGTWTDGKVEMCGLEFCGNASRAFALMIARGRDVSKVKIDMSGCEEMLDIDVDVKTGYTKVKMPMAKLCEKIDLRVLSEDAVEKERLADARLVHMDGIVHVVLKGVAASETLFNDIRAVVEEKYSPAATGVMFVDDEMKKMVPVVYVKDVDSTYFEGSCGSGTTACGIAFGQGLCDGSYSWNMKQPAGEIIATVDVKDGRVTEAYIEGPVEISDSFIVEI